MAKNIRRLCQFAMAYPEERCLKWANWSATEHLGAEGLCNYVCDTHRQHYKKTYPLRIGNNNG
jgi:hypothetical protein